MGDLLHYAYLLVCVLADIDHLENQQLQLWLDLLPPFPNDLLLLAKGSNLTRFSNNSQLEF